LPPTPSVFFFFSFFNFTVASVEDIVSLCATLFGDGHKGRLEKQTIEKYKKFSFEKK
jgi:hypothetical protein